MMSSNSKSPDTEAEAAEWVVRLGDPNSSNHDLAEFQAWLAQGPLQQEAYEFASQTWADLSCLSAEGLELEDLHSPAAKGGGSAGVRAGVTKAATRGAFRQVALSLCLLTAFMLGGLSLWYGNLLIYLQADYIAETGQNRSVTLADGTVVDLASGSAIAVDFDDTERALRLLAGKAYFVVAPRTTQDPRAFSVTARGVTTTALGTEFMVDMDGRGLEVLVTEHSVSVDQSQSEPILVSMGHAVFYEQSLGFSELREDSGEFSTAWRKGMLVFDNQPLDRVVAEINRHIHGRILLRNADLGKRRVSGIFDAHDAADAVDRIAAELGLKRVSVPPLVTLLY